MLLRGPATSRPGLLSRNTGADHCSPCWRPAAPRAGGDWAGAPRFKGALLRRGPAAPRARSDDEEPDWDKEMSIFKERTMRPNQLATLRELESKVSVGKVRARARAF